MAYGQSSPAQGIGADPLQDSGNCLYVVNSDLIITYVNPVYLKFAEENGGTDIAAKYGVGCRVLDAISGPMRDYYDSLYRRCLEHSQVASHEYEGSSPELFRSFRMNIFPLGESHGILVDHALIVSREHDREAHQFDPNVYVDGDGLLHQCGDCRRMKNQKNMRWDWCPDALGRLKFSHALCDSCVERYCPQPNGE